MSMAFSTTARGWVRGARGMPRCMLGRLASECLQERADVDSVLVGVAEGKAGVDLIAIPTSDTLAGQIASVDEVIHETLCRPFGDSDALRDLAQADLGVLGDADERTGVIREECPAHPGVTLVADSSGSAPGRCRS